MIPISGDRWQQATALFEAAVERPAAERDAFVSAAAGDDEALRSEVESLLRADADDTGLLEPEPRRAAATAWSTATTTSSAEISLRAMVRPPTTTTTSAWV